MMPMYDLIKYNSNYSDTAGSLRFYSKDKATVLMLTLQIMMDIKSLKYKAKSLRDIIIDRGKQF